MNWTYNKKPPEALEPPTARWYLTLGGNLASNGFVNCGAIMNRHLQRETLWLRAARCWKRNTRYG